jgi:glycosyltransferase involved in cell wall biosynthesis
MTSNSDATSKTSPAPASGLALIDALLQQEGLSARVQASLVAVRDAIAEDPLEDRPFLTVLLRTQGRRLEPIKDALLCLAAQTDQDFEVVIIDHDSTEDGAEGVRQVVASQPGSFRGRIRIVEVKGGTRSAPLNAGIDVARGRYVSVFDDDDILFADWVEQFHAASVDGGNRLLRAQTATQRAKPESWGQLAGQRTLSWPSAEYARSFDQVAHLLVNHSPFMSWAFPSAIFTHLGLRFDEELDVCEDWDMILRASLLVGVKDVPALTSTYRRWEGAASSYTVHSSKIWQESEKRVIDRLNASVVSLPPGSVYEIRKLLQKQDDESAKMLSLVLGSRSWRWSVPLRVVKNRSIRVRGTVLHWRNLLNARLHGTTWAELERARLAKAKTMQTAELGNPNDPQHHDIDIDSGSSGSGS